MATSVPGLEGDGEPHHPRKDQAHGVIAGYEATLRRRAETQLGVLVRSSSTCRPWLPSTCPIRRSETSFVSTSDLACQILEGLQAGDGYLVIQAPDREQRACYRRAIHYLITTHQVPDGFSLRHTGRDRGDLIIRLTALPEKGKPVEPPARVPVPDSINEVMAAVRLLGEGDRLAVTADTLDRALRIAQAIANECTARSWEFHPKPEGRHGFRIIAGDCTFDFTLTEELVDRDIHDSQTLQVLKYPWQRVPLKVAKVGSGRLTLLLDEPFSRRSWSDRTRWTLDDKLGAAFAELEKRLADAEEKQRRLEEDLLRRQQDWHAAVPVAKCAYVVDLNRRRLREQVTKYGESLALRAYSEDLLRSAEAPDQASTGEAIHRWAEWAQSEADRLDPLNKISALAYFEPDEIGPADFDRFMPPGMSAYRRPTS
jgi:hypothetical protein